MSEIKDSTRAERIAKYKEERRKQLAAQFVSLNVPTTTSSANNTPTSNHKYRYKETSSSSGSEAPRTTRTSRLRAAAVQQDIIASSPTKYDIRDNSGIKSEKDKSSKRKSNLNRSLTSETVPSPSDDNKARRRQRRFFPPEVLQLSNNSNSNDEKTSDNSFTASHNTAPLSLSITASTNSTRQNVSSSSNNSPSTRRNDLSYHMENARKSVVTSDLNRRYKSNNRTDSDSESKNSKYVMNKENRKLEENSHNNRKLKPINNDQNITSAKTSKRLDEITALTHETLARVDNLVNKKNKRDISKVNDTVNNDQSKDHAKPSILKKKSNEHVVELPTVPIHIPSGPISILKRKVSSDESRQETPVTFSPNVIEPTTTNRKQGILKKRRSLDESQVLRHRSCSPDVNKIDSRSILKNKRRSSLEEIIRTSSDTSIHGILKRRTSKHEDEYSDSLSSPQSILKRRSGASSAGSSTTTGTPHVSITTAVILAAACGAEMILENETVKPILKKKSIDDLPFDNNPSESLKPILKKKSSTDTDETEERPRPILKLPKNLEQQEEHRYYNQNYAIDTDCDFRPILKRDERPRLSFCCEDNFISTTTELSDEIKCTTTRNYRSSSTICTEIQSNIYNVDKEDDRHLRKPRPLSVSELTKKFESNVNTGAIPKKSSFHKRNYDRSRTQPVTYNEFEASLKKLKNPHSEDLSSSTFSDHYSLLDLSTSAGNAKELNYSMSLPSSETSEEKMFADSAFQSLGDGLELEQDDKTSVKQIRKLESPKLESQMKSIAEEAKSIHARLKSRKTTDANSNRFATQPVTFDELEKASKYKDEEDQEDEPSELSFFEKIEHFNQFPVSPQMLGRRNARFKTHPIIFEQIERAKCFLPDKTEIKSILKSKYDPNKTGLTSSRSFIKKPDSLMSPMRSILKNDLLDHGHDEGISSDDSVSDEKDTNDISRKKVKNLATHLAATLKFDQPYQRKLNKVASDETSDESSGGKEIQTIIGIKKTSCDKLAPPQGNVLKSKSLTKINNDNNETNTGVRRSMTFAMHRSIGELQAKLQESGDTNWRRRLSKNTDELNILNVKNICNEDVSEKNSLLAARKDELDASAKQWKSRIDKSDLDNFTIAGRMQQIKDIQIGIPNVNSDNKKIPKAKRYKGKEEEKVLDTSVTDVEGRKVKVSRPDDETFTNFFKALNDEEKVKEKSLILLEDLDSVERESDKLLVQKRNIRVQRRREATKNPIKALAARTDIKYEYTEVITGVAEREKTRLNVEKLAKSNSNKAVEALAGLASKENFSAIALKKGGTTQPTNSYIPFSNLMLLLVKGRRHVQTRLVEPIADSINDGDCYILITPKAIYNYVGTYSNVIEQSRASGIASSIQQKNDMGCKADKVITLNSKNEHTLDAVKFWKILGGSDETIPHSAGHPDEDEMYETHILNTNMIHELKNNELVPAECWGTMPKIQMLKSNKVYVFDFGSEMYVWSGKNALFNDKKIALGLAKDIWKEGYNYDDCDICPIDVAQKLGSRSAEELPKKNNKRPDWALFAKLTQHTETILFKEKFLNWPDFSRVIKVKENEPDKCQSPQIEINAYENIDEFIKAECGEPDLVIEGTHLGRGRTHFDEELRRKSQISTIDLLIWRIYENTYEEIDKSLYGQFYDVETYIIKWKYRVTITGRELSGKDSKHLQIGRDRTVYFCWLGEHASINEKGAAAIFTIELDNESAPQIRVTQGNEPPAFLQLFDGKMIIHTGRMIIHTGKFQCDKSDMKLYVTRGEVDNETVLLEVPCMKSSLRSRGSFILLDNTDTSCDVSIWYGCKCLERTRKVAKEFSKYIEKNSKMFGIEEDVDLDVNEMEDGISDRDFLQSFADEVDDDQYYSLKLSEEDFNLTPRMFYFDVLTGSFKMTEILCAHRSSYTTPFPFLQSELYSAVQPALFMFDNNYELWLWQGWWPENDEDTESSDQSSSRVFRWHLERRAAMQTAVKYWKTRGKDLGKMYLVWAGLEPIEFINLFHCWEHKESAAELNIKDGRKKDVIQLQEELTLLTRTTYPLSILLERPLPDCVDPTRLEIYLSDDDFLELLSMSKTEFQQLPAWKQSAVKKEKGLF